jgi:hypothetical protein
LRVAGILPASRGIGILPMIHGLEAHATSKGKMPSPRAARPLDDPTESIRKIDVGKLPTHFDPASHL